MFYTLIEELVSLGAIGAFVATVLLWLAVWGGLI